MYSFGVRGYSIKLQSNSGLGVRRKQQEVDKDNIPDGCGKLEDGDGIASSFIAADRALLLVD